MAFYRAEYSNSWLHVPCSSRAQDSSKRASLASLFAAPPDEDESAVAAGASEVAGRPGAEGGAFTGEPADSGAVEMADRRSAVGPRVSIVGPLPDIPRQELTQRMLPPQGKSGAPDTAASSVSRPFIGIQLCESLLCRFCVWAEGRPLNPAGGDRCRRTPPSRRQPAGRSCQSMSPCSGRRLRVRSPRPRSAFAHLSSQPSTSSHMK